MPRPSASQFHSRGFRGRARDNGRGRAGFIASSWNRSATAEPDFPPKDLGEVVDILCSKNIIQADVESPAIQDARGVASFNWIGGVDEPTIAIPGAPPRWMPPSAPPQLSQDSGDYYRDINAAYSPKYPLQATVHAILDNAAISTSSVDVVACASTLRSLFSFTLGESKAFQMGVEAIGDTVFFIRHQGTPRELIPDVRGYGHTMPEAYTNWRADVPGSVSNQRIVGYKFAGLECLVRYEPDGYLPEKFPERKTSASSSTYSQPDVLDLDVAMLGATVSQDLFSTLDDKNLVTKYAGLEIPQSATFELKTRTAKRKDEDFFPDLATRFWLTQTPNFIVAFHTHGRFEDIRISNVEGLLASWEANNHSAIKKFAGLIQWIVNRVRLEPDGKLELWRHDAGDMEVRLPGADLHGALPGDLEDRWIG